MFDEIENDLRDKITARKVAFLMYYVNGIKNLDEIQALYIVKSLDRLGHGNSRLSRAFFPPEVLPHLIFEFSDGVIRRYDEVNGFREI